MPSFADVAKYLVPALAGVAGAVNPRTADALNDIVSMRQAFKDRERRTRREDEADRLAQLRETRAAEKFDLEMGEFAREREKRAETDATISGMMQNLPSRFREDPVVISLANQGDVAGMMDYVEKEISRANLSGAIQSQIARVAPQALTPEMREAIQASPQMFGTGIQALAPQLMKQRDPTLTMEDIANLSIPPDAYVSGKVDVDGTPVTVSRQGAARGGSSTKVPEHLDPVVVRRRTDDYLNIVNDILSEYQNAVGMDVKGPRGKRDDTKKIAARNKKIDELRKKYLTERGKYMSSTEKWPAEYRAPAVSWDKLISDGGLKWSMPTTEKRETERKVSDSDTQTPKERSGVTGEVSVRGGYEPRAERGTQGKTAQAASDEAFLNWIKNKIAAGDTADLTDKDFERYWALTGGE